MKLDLNLLRVFDILIEVRSVSRAADRLGVTQSAVSHALGRMRAQLDDPLFVRARGGLRPTPRAVEIAAAVREGLSLLRAAVAPTSFDPATSTRTFSIGASSYFCATLLPVVIAYARVEAPQARFLIVRPGDALFTALDEGSSDLALGSFPVVPRRFARQVLFTERLVWIGRAAGAGDAEPAARPRLSLTRSPQPAVVEEPAVASRADRTALDPPHFPPGPSPVTIYDPLSAAAFLAGSDLVTLLPKQLARMMTARGNVAILAEADEDEVELAMLWHARATNDPAHLWLRGLVDRAVRSLG